MPSSKLCHSYAREVEKATTSKYHTRVFLTQNGHIGILAAKIVNLITHVLTYFTLQLFYFFDVFLSINSRLYKQFVSVIRIFNSTIYTDCLSLAQ